MGCSYKNSFIIKIKVNSEIKKGTHENLKKFNYPIAELKLGNTLKHI